VVPEHIGQLMAFGSATLHEAQGQKGALASTIKPLDPGMKLVGPAYPVFSPPGDNMTIHHAVYHAPPGSILVISTDNYIEAGAWGDILSLAAVTQGIAGLVTDGAVRDSDAIIAMGFPLFSQGLSIKGTSKVKLGTLGKPVICGGVAIDAGDFIVADRDGVVVIPAGNLETVMQAARLREAKEEALRAEIRAGKTTLELLGVPALPT